LNYLFYLDLLIKIVLKRLILFEYYFFKTYALSTIYLSVFI